MSMLARPVYNYAEVDRLLRLTPGTAKRWIDGYERAGQLDCLNEMAQGFGDRVTLAGYVGLKTLRHIPVFFLVDRGGDVSRRALDP
ncbi:MAG: hypothetical protein ACRDQ9_19980 [Pseudonocardiaceae bacterium]